MPRLLRLALPCSLLLIHTTGCKPDGNDDEVADDESGTSGTTTAGETASDSGTDSGGDTDTGEPGCQTDTPEQLRDCVDGARYQADLEFIAQPRPPNSPHWQEVQNLCFDRFTELGLDVDLVPYATGTNVVGRLEGTQTPDEYILIAAHYDHIPDCPGADDNASGVAGMLETARVLTQRSYPRSAIFACWDEEELGLLGAEAYAADALQAGDQLVFNYNFEMIGYTDPTPGAQTVPAGLDLLFPAQYGQLEEWGFPGDWIALIVDYEGVEHATYMAAHAEALGLPHLLLDLPEGAENQPLLADLRRSDHAAFWELGYAAMMITDTSEFRYQAYHCENGLQDTVDKLDNAFSTKVVQASVGAAAQSLGLAP
ncbi:M28 family metallopeptidase [Nannocystaceae bacterium ST9]